MHSEQFLIGKDEQAHLKKKIKKKSTGTINKVSKFFLKNLIYPELLLLKKRPCSKCFKPELFLVWISATIHIHLSMDSY